MEQLVSLMGATSIHSSSELSAINNRGLRINSCNYQAK